MDNDKCLSKIIIISFIFFIISLLYYTVNAESTVLGTVKEDFGDKRLDIPIKGIRVNLIDQDTGASFTTVTNPNGDFHFYDIPSGNYTIQYKYGDISVIKDFPEENLSPEEVCKYNGQDYIASYLNGVTVELAEQIIPKIDKDAAQVFFVVDCSGSMCAGINDGNSGITRLDIVKEASKILVDNIFDADDNIYMGLIEFNQNVHMLSHLCRDREGLHGLIDGMTPAGSTNITDALAMARTSFVNADTPKIILLLSDGCPNVKADQLKDEIKRVRDDNIELFSLFVEDDLKGSLLTKLHEYFDEGPTGSTKLVFKKSGDELANYMTEFIPSWIVEKVEEMRALYESRDEIDPIVATPECGIEDEDRRNIVDDYFSRLFHYQYRTCEEDMAGTTYLFQCIDNSSQFSQQELEDFSNHTYMTVSCTDLIITENRKITNLNLKLKRREPFLMDISTKAVAFRITLSDGTILMHDIHNENDFHIFYASLEPEIVLGSLVEIEYEVVIRNSSETIDCTQLEFLAYLPRDLTLENDKYLITDPRKTNSDYGWHLTKKEYLYETGYISNYVYNNPELTNRDMAVFYLDYTNGLKLDAQSTFTTHFVASVCVGNAEQIPYNSIEDVEVLGYQNNKYRRMEYVVENPVIMDGFDEPVIQKSYTSLYPGDGNKEHVDFAEDTNREFIFPPTGKQRLTLFHHIKLLIILMINIIK